MFGTLDTNGAAQTIDRIVDAFPANMQDMIPTQLGSSIQALISLVLGKKIGGGRIAGDEIMVNTTSIAALIRDSKTLRITAAIPTGAALGMITMDTPSAEPGESRAHHAGRGGGEGSGSHHDAHQASGIGAHLAAGLNLVVPASYV